MTKRLMTTRPEDNKANARSYRNHQTTELYHKKMFTVHLTTRLYGYKTIEHDCILVFKKAANRTLHQINKLFLLDNFGVQVNSNNPAPSIGTIAS